MRKILFVCLAVTAFFLFSCPIPAQKKTTPVFPNGSYCDDVNSGLCTELDYNRTYEGKYTGHDEPSLIFYSNTPGSGNSGIYYLRLPKDPTKQPVQDGRNGVTWNFELHPAFWVGMALCDSQSAPVFTDKCKPDTDENIFDNADPTAKDFIGKHPGTAFLELQFYPPGWNGNDCYPTTWCGAMTIDSYSKQEATGLANNPDCLNTVGQETINFAFVTFTGKSQAAADPLARFNDPTAAAVIPDPAQTVSFNSGDLLRIYVHDTEDGLRAEIDDLTTGARGSMTASIANGFAQVNFNPSATAACSTTPYAFHPMYSTSSEHTRVVWAAHSYNTAFSDEIGHYEWCEAIASEGGACTLAAAKDRREGLDGDDFVCVDNAGFPTLPQVTACEATESDFDGVPYLAKAWPGGTREEEEDNQTPTPITFTSPVFLDEHGEQRNYSRVAFEADMPGIEFATTPVCNTTTGSGCTNPPAGAQFYPIFTTTEILPGVCGWQEGGGHIPGTTNNFGGNSVTEYGPILSLTYIKLTSSVQKFEDFRQILADNPCSYPIKERDN
jgi:hypothetical protein